MRPFDPRLLQEIPASRRPLAILAALGTLNGAFAISQAILISALVVAFVDGRDFTMIGIAVICVLTLRGIILASSEKTATAAGATISGALRDRALKSWMQQPADIRPSPAAMVTLATQGSTAVAPYVARYIPALVAGVVVPALAFIALLFTDWVAALIVALTLPMLPFFAALIGRYTEESTARRWQESTQLAGHFLDVMRGLPTLVNYNRAHNQVKQVQKVGDRHRKATMQTLRIAFTSAGALELLATISVAVVAVFVGVRLAWGQLPLSVGLTAILLAPEAYWPIRRVGLEFHAAADGVEAIEALLNADAGPPAAKPSKPAEQIATSAPLEHHPAPANIHCENLTYAYPGSTHPVLQNYSTHIAGPTGLFTLTGPSGCGKSTLLEIIAGLRQPSAGQVNASPAHLVSQRPFIAPLSVAANVLLGTDHSWKDPRTQQAALATGFAAVIANLPDKENTLLGDQGFGLSAGQRARLVLMRAWLADTPIILLDEPTAHVDTQSRDALHEAIIALSKQKLVLVATHDETLARHGTPLVLHPAEVTA